MAKAKETTEVAKPEVNLEQMYRDMGMTEDQIAEMLNLTGQSAVFSMDRTPVLKVNKFPIEDENGKAVPMGNFVLGQIATGSDDDVKLEEIGEDCGKNPKITIFKRGYQFNFFPKNKDKKLACASQIVFDMNEEAVGGRLGYKCMDKSCPKRAEGLDKDDKCKCSEITFVEVTTLAGEKKPAVLYFKGTSYMPFQDYLKEAGDFPLFFAPTLLDTERKINGNNVYWIIKPDLLKTEAYDPETCMAHFNLAKEIDANCRRTEEQRKMRSASNNQKQLEAPAPSDVPAGLTEVNPIPKSGGVKRSGDVEDVEF